MLDKHQLRRQMKAIRAQVSSDELTACSARIADRLLSMTQVQHAQTFFAYVSYRTEVQTHALLQRLMASGKLVTVPKVLTDIYMEPHWISRWEQLEPDAMGIPSPVGTSPYEGPLQVCLTPGLAFTANGDRLGYGRGHYDRFFSRYPEIYKIGLALECQLVDEISTETTDQPLDAVVTEQRVIFCRPS